MCMLSRPCDPLEPLCNPMGPLCDEESKGECTGSAERSDDGLLVGCSLGPGSLTLLPLLSSSAPDGMGCLPLDFSPSLEVIRARYRPVSVGALGRAGCVAVPVGGVDVDADGSDVDGLDVEGPALEAL